MDLAGDNADSDSEFGSQARLPGSSKVVIAGAQKAMFTSGMRSNVYK